MSPHGLSIRRGWRSAPARVRTRGGGAHFGAAGICRRTRGRFSQVGESVRSPQGRWTDDPPRSWRPLNLVGRPATPQFEAVRRRCSRGPAKTPPWGAATLRDSQHRQVQVEPVRRPGPGGTTGVDAASGSGIASGAAGTFAVDLGEVPAAPLCESCGSVRLDSGRLILRTGLCSAQAPVAQLVSCETCGPCLVRHRLVSVGSSDW